MADDRLKLKTFLVGESLTLADISLYFSWTAISKYIENNSR
jgi:glutathione S-transferase